MDKKCTDIEVREKLLSLEPKYGGTYLFLDLKSNNYDFSRYLDSKKLYTDAVLNYGILIVMLSLSLAIIIILSHFYSDTLIRVPLAFVVILLGATLYSLIKECRAVSALTKILNHPKTYV